jgi:hypothetical protein
MTLTKTEQRRDDHSPAHVPGVSVSVTRRSLMNSLVALPIVAALPVAAPAMPSTAAADQSTLDAELVQAVHDLQAADRGISDLHDRFGDDADSREDYSALEDRRNEHIATLITVPAKSMTGIQVKAVCVRWRTLIEDYDQHQQVAVSLADDLVQLGPIPEALLAPVAKPSPAIRSPAIEAVERLRRAQQSFERIYDQFDLARSEAAGQHGREPLALIAWRNYSHIGGSEIEGARQRFLAEGEDPKIIEREYRDAKKRYRKVLEAVKDWEKRAGLSALAEANDQARSELHAAEKALGEVGLLSVADAAALIDLVHANLEVFTELADWEVAAMSNARKFLNRMSSGAKSVAA